MLKFRVFFGAVAAMVLTMFAAVPSFAQAGASAAETMATTLLPEVQGEVVGVLTILVPGLIVLAAIFAVARKLVKIPNRLGR